MPDTVANPESSLETRTEIIIGENTETVLGGTVINPFSVSRINQAKAALNNNTITASSHRYIRFRPQNYEQMKSLGGQVYPVVDFPLDRKIISIGNKPYANPDVPNGQLPYMYASVPVGSALPSGVPYDLLDNVSLTYGDTNVIKKSFEMAGYTVSDTLYSEYRKKIIEQGDDGSSGGSSGDDGSSGGSAMVSTLVTPDDCSCRNGTHRRNLAGCIRVFDSQLNDWVGARQVRIIAIGPFGAWVTARTNDQGCYSNTNHRLAGRWFAHVEMNSSTVAIYNGQRQNLVGNILASAVLFPHRYFFKGFWGNDANETSHDFGWEQDDSQKRNAIWKSITINNAVHEMHQYSSGTSWSGGILTPPNNIRILSHNFSGNGAAPMLNKIGWHYGVGTLQSLGVNLINLIVEDGANLLTVPIIQSILTSLSPIFQIIAPDVFIGTETNVHDNINDMASDQLKELAYHELAHTIHWRNVSDRYWIDEIQYTIDNNGYGDGTANGAGRPAVVEAWAYFMGATVANAAYPANSSLYRFQSAGDVYWQATNPVRTSFLQAIEAFDPRSNSDIRWIPGGLMHDLRDNVVETIFPVTDNVSGFTIPRIFSALQDDVTSPLQYRDRLMQQNNNQQAEVNVLFQGYNIQ